MMVGTRLRGRAGQSVPVQPRSAKAPAMSQLILPIALLLGSFAPAAAQDVREPRAYGVETTIAFAANGGLRDWRSGPAGADIVYVRDRTERWYEVTLSGPCGENASSETLVYTTDANGRFDRFSNVYSAREPERTCSVRSIKTSPDPATLTDADD